MKSRKDLAVEYLGKYLPNFSKRSIAKKMYLDHPLTFPTEESARSSIRNATGTNGKHGRHNAEVIYKTAFSSSNPYNLPESDESEFVIYKLPVVNNRILFLSDIHLPYHNIAALTEALNYGKDKNINTIWLNGDVMDCHHVSSHEKDPKKRDFKGEIEIAKQFLDILRGIFPTAKIFFKEGNHETRWKRFLMKNAPVVLNMSEFEMPVLLGLRERGIEWIPNKQLSQFGKLNVIHGNEMAGGGGINVARTLWLRAGESVIAGDKHKTQSAIKTTISNTVYGTWSVGCLCELNPDYMPYNEWNRGFAYIETKESGDFKVWNEQIFR